MMWYSVRENKEFKLMDWLVIIIIIIGNGYTHIVQK